MAVSPNMYCINSYYGSSVVEKNRKTHLLTFPVVYRETARMGGGGGGGGGAL